MKKKTQRKEAARQRRVRRLQKTIPAEFSTLMRGLPLPPPFRWRDVAEAFRTGNIDIVMKMIKQRAKTPKIELSKYKRGARNWALSRKDLDALNAEREREFKLKLAQAIASVPDKKLAGQE